MDYADDLALVVAAKDLDDVELYIYSCEAISAVRS